MDKPREVVFHQSINRPNLIMGCDRELFLSISGLCGILAFSIMTLWGVALAAVIWPCSVWALSRMAKADPIMRKVWRKHVQYKPYYPAKSLVRVAGPSTRAGWR
jgi:type IV secretory pathway TrbD component